MMATALTPIQRMNLIRNNFLLKWGTFESQIVELGAYLTHNYGSIMSNATKNNIAILHEQLKTFAEDYYEYFYYGIEDGDVLEDPKFEYIVRAAMYHIDVDITLIQQAISHRVANAQSTLEKAAKLAYLALQQAVDDSLIIEKAPNQDDPSKLKYGIVTYFTRIPAVRVIPYAPIAFISVPRTSSTNERDYLAIPHETGHYVYWQGSNPNTGDTIERIMHEIIDNILAGPAVNHLQNYQKELKKWSEEIFADVYCTLVGGSASVLSAQYRANSSNVNEFLFDDGDHPIPAVRPIIALHTLRRFGGNNTLIDDLEANWAIIKASRNIPQVLYFELTDTYPDYNVLGTDPTRRKIEPAVLEGILTQIVDALHGTGILNLNPASVWSPVEYSIAPSLLGFEKVQDLNELARLFNSTHINNIIGYLNGGAAVEDDDLRAEYSISEWKFDEWLIQKGWINPNKQDWRDVLKAPGWTFEGPHGQDKVP
jgi:hypothetical protein